jgi:hypothetical protein
MAMNLSIADPPEVDWKAIATRSTRNLMVKPCNDPHAWVKGEFVPVGICERCQCIADYEAALKAEAEIST